MEEIKSTPTEMLVTHLLSELSDLKMQLAGEKEKQGRMYESEKLDKLFESLAKAQSEMEIAKTDSSNPFFKSKYADLASMVRASRPYLAKNGLSIIQRISPNGNGNLYLYSRLGHSSGQWMESRVMIDPPKKDIQALGSYMTYLRRYTYSAMVGVVSSDEDDDGQEGMPDKGGSKSEAVPEKISKAQLQILSSELEGEVDMMEYIMKTAAISKLSDLPAKKYSNVVSWVRDKKSQSSSGEEE